VPKKKKTQGKKEQVYICTCGIKAKDKIHEGFFSWQNVEGKVVMLCWNCADRLHKDVLSKEEMEVAK
jgi:hypothetical protein